MDTLGGSVISVLFLLAIVLAAFWLLLPYIVYRLLKKIHWELERGNEINLETLELFEKFYRAKIGQESN